MDSIIGNNSTLGRIAYLAPDPRLSYPYLIVTNRRDTLANAILYTVQGKQPNDHIGYTTFQMMDQDHTNPLKDEYTVALRAQRNLADQLENTTHNIKAMNTHRNIKAAELNGAQCKQIEKHNNEEEQIQDNFSVIKEDLLKKSASSTSVIDHYKTFYLNN